MPDYPKPLQAVSTDEARKISLYRIRDTIGKINTAIVATAVQSGDKVEVTIPMSREALSLREALSDFYRAEGWHTAIRRRQVAKEPKRKYKLCFILSTKPIKTREKKGKLVSPKPCR